MNGILLWLTAEIEHQSNIGVDHMPKAPGGSGECFGIVIGDKAVTT
jgi:hypothetical protein